MVYINGGLYYECENLVLFSENNPNYQTKITVISSVGWVFHIIHMTVCLCPVFSFGCEKYVVVYQQATKINAEAIDKFNNNTHAIKRQYKVVADALCELLGRVNLSPYEKPKFKDDNGHVLLNSLYLYPWYYFKCFYSSKHIRGFFKLIAWSIWLICIGLLFFITRDNAILQKQKNINRYVHAYFSDNDEVMMELDGIDLMFSDENLKPMPIKDYREYMKDRKKEAKDKDKSGKRK